MNEHVRKLLAFILSQPQRPTNIEVVDLHDEDFESEMLIWYSHVGPLRELWLKQLNDLRQIKTVPHPVEPSENHD